MNHFQKTYPALLLLYFALQLFFMFWSQQPIVVAIAFFSLICYILCLQDWRDILQDIGYYFVIALLITIMYAAFVHNGVTPLFFYNDHAVTKEAIVRGGMLGFIVMTSAFWLKAVMLTMQTNHFLFLFTKFHPALGLFASMCFRFIPYYKQLWRDNYLGQHGVHFFQTKSRFDRLGRYVLLHIHTLTVAIDAVFWKPLIMLSKGFNKKRTQYQLFTWKRGDTLIAVSTLLCTSFLLIELPRSFEYFPKLGALHLSPGVQVVLCLFYVLPVFLEGKELLRWRYLQSKM